MKRMARLLLIIILLLLPFELAIAQAQPNQNKAASPKSKNETLELGKSYDLLRPEQRPLGRLHSPLQRHRWKQACAPSGLRLSVRITFDAVTRADRGGHAPHRKRSRA